MTEYAQPKIAIVPTTQEGLSPRAWRNRLVVGGTMAGFVLLVIISWSVTQGPFWWAYLQYEPQEGDILFQSLQVTPAVEAIEGATGSPFSHCGIVARDEKGGWVVYESYHRVERTPLRDYLGRGRNSGFAIYRLRPEFQERIPGMLQFAKKQLGLPVDDFYSWNDEEFYSSELIYKAYQSARPTSDESDTLGELVLVGDLQWKRFAELFKRQRGEVPTRLSVITPRNLALASQLELVQSYAIQTP